MKKLLLLPLLASNIHAMVSTITWEQMVQIGRQLYQEHGDEVDLQVLLLQELKESMPMPIKEEISPKLKRGNTHEKINDGIKFACNKLLHSIRKVSSAPAP